MSASLSTDWIMYLWYAVMYIKYFAMLSSSTDRTCGNRSENTHACFTFTDGNWLWSEYININDINIDFVFTFAQFWHFMADCSIFVVLIANTPEGRAKSFWFLFAKFCCMLDKVVHTDVTWYLFIGQVLTQVISWRYEHVTCFTGVYASSLWKVL
jgi:hypothetical protein